MSTEAEIAYEEMKQKLIEVVEKVKKDRADCAKERAEEKANLKAQILTMLVANKRRVIVFSTQFHNESGWVPGRGFRIPDSMKIDRFCQELVEENPCLKFAKYEKYKGGYADEKRIILFK